MTPSLILIVAGAVLLVACDKRSPWPEVNLTEEGRAACAEHNIDCSVKGGFALVGEGKPYQILAGNMKDPISGASDCVLVESKQMDWGTMTTHACKFTAPSGLKK
jgi:hypothetical protein